VSSDNNSGDVDWLPWWFTSLDTADSGRVEFRSYTTSTNVDGSNPGGDAWSDEEQGVVYGKDICPYQQECSGSTGECCASFQEEIDDVEYGAHACTFIKHWPDDEEQTVILHFQDFYYYDSDTDVTQIKLWGQPGFAYEITNVWWGTLTNVGFVVKIKTNTRYTIHESSFQWPVEDWDDTFQEGYNGVTVHQHQIWHQMYYDSFANAKPEIDIAGMAHSVAQGTGAVVVCNCSSNNPTFPI
jgi:hypothetical protein